MRVLQSFPTDRPTTNPYLLQLAAVLQREHTVVGFGWKRAIVGRYDVFHAHWPEALLHGSSPTRSFARRLLFRGLLARLRLQRTAVVRTLHNVRSHEAAPRNEQLLLDKFDRRTTLWIRLNDSTPVPPGALVRTIGHGDYRDWFAELSDREPVEGRLLFFGLLRAYKGVENLIDVFRALSLTDDPGELSLHIVGRPYTPEVAHDVAGRAAEVDRVTLRLGHASDDVLAAEIRESTLVVLPYREMHNSGAALLALSLNRPVLVPSNTVTQALRSEVGGEWVQTYEGDFSASALTGALDRVRGIQEGPAPDLSARDWPGIAAAHVAAYEAARRAARPSSAEHQDSIIRQP